MLGAPIGSWGFWKGVDRWGAAPGVTDLSEEVTGLGRHNPPGRGSKTGLNWTQSRWSLSSLPLTRWVTSAEGSVLPPKPRPDPQLLNPVPFLCAWRGSRREVSGTGRKVTNNRLLGGNSLYPLPQALIHRMEEPGCALKGERTLSPGAHARTAPVHHCDTIVTP